MNKTQFLPLRMSLVGLNFSQRENFLEAQTQGPSLSRREPSCGKHSLFLHMVVSDFPAERKLLGAIHPQPQQVAANCYRQGLLSLENANALVFQ
jgi:hypothetical protein